MTYRLTAASAAASNIASAALDLVLPAGCAGCARDRGDCVLRGGLCPGCVRQIRDTHALAWRLPEASDAVCVPVFAAAPYDATVRSALLEYKERGRLSLRRELGHCLLVSVLAALGAAPAPPGDEQRVLVVPVPSGRRTRRLRGHDPVGELARIAAHAGRATGVDLRVRFALRHARWLADQAGLDIEARFANLFEAFAVSRAAQVWGQRVVVVDDIVTTGATALEAVRALTASGARVCAVAAVAGTVRRFPQSGLGQLARSD